MATNAKEAPMGPLADKILRNAKAVDAAIVILQKKLLKLLECNILKHQIEDVNKSLDSVYEFVTKHYPEWEEPQWKSKLLEAIYKMEDGIDIFRSRIALRDSTNVNQSIGSCWQNTFPISCAKCLLGGRLQKFKHQMTALKKTHYITDKEKTPQIHDPREWDALFSLDISSNDIAAHKSEMTNLSNDILADLKEKRNRVKVIAGDRGRGGVGKTFLARKIFIQHHDKFDCCAWVNFSKIGKSEEVICSKLKQIFKHFVQQPYIGLQEPFSILQDLLKKAFFGKSYLIVFDDVADGNLLCDVLNSLPDSNSGGCVLITTQGPSIANRMDPKPIDLRRLGEHEIDELVEGKLKIVGASLDVLTRENEKGAFIEKSRGSPLILRLLSGLIGKSSYPIKDLINGIPDTKDLDPLFAYCYNKMGGELKPCFLYMTHFPKFDSIPVRRLLRLWLSEGLLVPKAAELEPEDLGQSYLKELLLRNLIEAVEWKEDGSPRKVRVVTCLYNYFHSGAIGTELFYVNTEKEIVEGQPPEDQNHQTASRLRWLVERSNIKELSLFPAAKVNRVRTLLSFNLREGKLTQDIGDFLKTTVSGKHPSLLTVLDLEGVYKPNLNKVLGKLVLLKHLDLRSTALDSLPNSVADLPYLETLDLKHTNVTELPKSFWKNSRNLRHLYLNGCCPIDRDTLSPSFAFGLGSEQPFANLHTFSGAAVDSINFQRAANTESHTIVGLSNLKKLTKLGIRFQYDEDNQKSIGDWISSLTTLKSLKFEIVMSRKPSELPEPLQFTRLSSLSKLYLLGKFHQSSKYFMPQTLITLTLSGSNMTNQHVIQLGKLANLKVLNLKGESFEGTTLTFSQGCLQNLEVLRLWKSDTIEILKLEDKLPKLKTIEFRSCSKMDRIDNIQNVENNEVALLIQLIDMPKEFVDKMDVKGSKSKIIVKAKKG